MHSFDGSSAAELEFVVSSLSPSARTGKLKVLQVGKFYPPHMGGIETHLQVLSSRLRGAVDLRVIVASDGREGAEEVLDGVAVSRVPTWMTVASTPLCPGMIAKIRNCGADIVHIHLPNPAAVLAFLASGYRGRLVVTYHSDTVSQKFLGAMFEPFLHAALRRSAAIIATSPDYLRTSSVLASHRDRCDVIPLGVALEEYDHCDPAAVAEVRRQYGDKLILSVGRLVYYKGFEYLIRAMGDVPGVLLIVGDGPLLAQLSALAHETGVGERVHFLRRVDQARLVACYHAADVFVLPSTARSEAFGIVQIEAMAAGLPVVNTRLDSGVPFVSLHEETGLTVPPADSGALAAAINRLLEQRDLRQKLSDAARRRASAEFSVETMVSRTLSLYDRVMAAS
jgi:rhamnosyl/mannosyltransferase